MRESVHAQTGLHLYAVTRYRDSRTGHFVSKSTWTRSKAQGGTRFKRETVRQVSKHRKERERAVEKEREEEAEYGGAFNSP